MMNDLIRRLILAERCFKSGKYRRFVTSASAAYLLRDYSLCEEHLSKLPTSDQLLSRLLEKIKGKSVYKTIKKIQGNKSDGSLDELKGLSSLLTHTVIEIQQGNTEYKMLLFRINEKINELIYNQR